MITIGIDESPFYHHRSYYHVYIYIYTNEYITVIDSDDV